MSVLLQAEEPVRVLVWDEQQPRQSQGYGDKFLGDTIATHLASLPGLKVSSTHIDAPEQGLSDAVLNKTDVIVFWSHVRQKEQDDTRVQSLVKRVLEGKLSLIALHSAHWSKPFVQLMQERAKSDAAKEVPGVIWEYSNDQPYGVIRPRVAPITPLIEKGENGVWKLTLPQCVFPSFRADGAASHVTTLLPWHPIAKGLPAKWVIPQTEMYGEPFHVPKPDEVVFDERWDKGEYFRSGCVWQVGRGRVFYFRPGHETYPVFKQAEPLRVIENAVRWLGAKKESSNPGEPTNATEAAIKKAKSDAELEKEYQSWVSKLSPEEQAWERVLENQLGGFYLPIHKREKVAGRSNAWDYVRDDPSLPRVLLIGDSVSRGYTKAVRERLKGRANVHRAPANCGPTASGLKNMEVWLGDGKWDLIHFNFGIHDRATPIPDYIQRLEQLVVVMKQTGARLMWASTTPCPDTPDGKSKSAPIVLRNAAALGVMKKHDIAIDDLFEAVTPHLASMQNPNDVHFNAEGYEFLGKVVAGEIEKKLADKC